MIVGRRNLVSVLGNDWLPMIRDDGLRPIRAVGDVLVEIDVDE